MGKTTERLTYQQELLKYGYSDRIMIYDKSQTRYVQVESINVISAARDYTAIETLDGKKYLVVRTMGQWVDRLPKEHFIRIHRSFIINLNHIEKILRFSTSSAKVYIKNYPEPVTISRNFYKELKNKYL